MVLMKGAFFGVMMTGSLLTSPATWAQANPGTLAVPAVPGQGANIKQPASALGGPITPTEPDFFETSDQGSANDLAPSEASGTSTIRANQTDPTTPPAPFVNEYRGPSGVGIINLKFD